MKILYVGSNRGDAVSVATGLRALAADATVVWTPRLDRTPTWIEQNPDVAALIVEEPIDHEHWLLVVEHLRRIPSHPAVVCLAAEGATPPFDTPEPPPDETIARNPSWLRDLPVAVGRAIGRARASGQERAARADLERKLAAATMALDQADERHRAAAEQLASVQRQHEVSLLRATATRQMLDEQLRNAAIEVERARHDQAAAAARAEQLSGREAELSALVAEAAAARLSLERRAAEDAERFAERERDLEARISEESDKRTRGDASLERSIADAERLTERVADLTSRVTAVEADRDGLARQLADAERKLELSTGREKELEARIDHECSARAAHEQAVIDAEAALRLAEERHDAALAASAREFAERQAEFDRARTEAAAVRDSLAQRLTDAEAALDELRGVHQAAVTAVERLTQREAEATSELADVRAARETLEHQLTDASNAIEAANDRAARDRAAEAARRADLEGRLARTHAEMATLRTTAREHAEGLENQLADQRREHEARVAETHEWSRRLFIESDALRQSLHGVQHRAEQLDGELGRTREQLAQIQSAARADVHRLTTERHEIERELADTRRTFQATLECLANEHDAAIAALAVAVGERDEQLREEETRFVAAQEAAEAERRELRDRFRAALALRDREIEQLQATVTALRQTLEAANRRQEILQAAADQVPKLRKQLDDGRAESARLFQQAPLPSFRCTKDGTLTEMNRAWASLTYRNIDELRGGFAEMIFESPTDLSGLVEQCLSTNAKQSIETTLRRKDGARLFVRLWAYASTAGLIEVAAENLTRVRILQDRLDRAHRMEAVGRLSSEVAARCTTLLNDVHQRLRQWLMGADGISSAQDGETLLEDLLRAASSLQQLAAYGEKKSHTPAVIDLNTLVRDLAPVLKQVAGDDVEVELPDSSPPLSVDIEPERIERVLVNLAAHGRERMASGGKLTLDLSAAIVDLRFTARHPNVRPGPHALITMRESRRSSRADGLLLSVDGSPGDSSPAGGNRKTGIDLGALQRLVGGCGGHLWMRVQPRGDIVAKVRLPLVTSYDQPESRALAALGERGRTITRWFQR
jgi:hypothetical protein